MNNTTTKFESAVAESLLTINLSPFETWMQLVFFYMFLLGIVSSIMGTLICVGIARNKQLRKRFFVIVGFLTFCRVLLALQYFVVAVYRILRTVGAVSVYQTRLYCHTVHFWRINGQTVEMFLLMALVVDQALAVLTINFYRSLTAKQAFWSCVLLTVVTSLLKLIPSYVDVDIYQIWPCVNSYSPTSDMFNYFSQTIDLAMVIVVLILYGTMMRFMTRKVKRMQLHANTGCTNQASLNVYMKRQLQLKPVLRKLVVTHCGLALSSRFLLFLEGVVPEQHKVRMSTYGGIVSCIDIFVNVGLLLMTNEKVRAASLPMWFLQMIGAKTIVSTEGLVHGSRTRTLAGTTHTGRLQSTRGLSVISIDQFHQLTNKVGTRSHKQPNMTGMIDVEESGKQSRKTAWDNNINEERCKI